MIAIYLSDLELLAPTFDAQGRGSYNKLLAPHKALTQRSSFIDEPDASPGGVGRIVTEVYRPGRSYRPAGQRPSDAPGRPRPVRSSGRKSRGCTRLRCSRLACSLRR